MSGNASQTCRFFGVSRALFYIWKERFEKHGVTGLRDLPRRPHKIRFRIPSEIVSLILRIREERRYGAVRISLYLQRHRHAYVSPTTILKIFHPDLRISYRHIPQSCPEVNGKVARSHRTDSHEFYPGRHFKHKKESLLTNTCGTDCPLSADIIYTLTK
jgi:hypothetical protein